MPKFRNKKKFNDDYTWNKVGLNPPGYKYMGPFNSLDRGRPTNYNDKIARDHDIMYDKIQKDGNNPYLNFNEADQYFLDNIKPNDVTSTIAKKAFELKKKFAPSLKDSNNKHELETYAKRHSHESDKLPVTLEIDPDVDIEDLVPSSILDKKYPKSNVNPIISEDNSVEPMEIEVLSDGNIIKRQSSGKSGFSRLSTFNIPIQNR